MLETRTKMTYKVILTERQRLAVLRACYSRKRAIEELMTEVNDANAAILRKWLDDLNQAYEIVVGAAEEAQS